MENVIPIYKICAYNRAESGSKKDEGKTLIE